MKDKDNPEEQLTAPLFRLSADLAATLDENEVCQRVVKGLQDTLGYDIVAIYLVDEITGDRVHKTSVGYVGPPPRLASGEGLSECPILDGELHYTPDVTQDPRYFYGMGGSEVDVPLFIGGEILGVLIAERAQRDAFEQPDFQVLTAAAQITGLAIEKARLFEETRSRTEELAVLNELSRAFTTQLSVGGVLDEVYHGVSRLLDTTNFYIALYDQEKDEVTFPINVSESKVDRQIIVMSADQGITGYIIRNQVSVLLEDNVVERSKELGIEYVGEPSLSYLGVPLMISDRVLGVMAIQSFTTPGLYGEHARDLLVSIASQAAVAIENARLFERAGREIAEREKVEKELRRQKEYYEALFVNSPVAVVTVGLEGEVVSWSPAAEKLFGYSQAEVIGRDVDALVANDDSIRAEAIRYTDMLRGDPTARDWGRLRVAARRTRKDGTLVDVEILGLPVIVAGESVGAIVIYYDLTERVRAETELRKYQERLEELVEERTADLRESEKRYRTLFDGIPVGLYRTTPAGQFLDANPAMVEFYGYPNREELLAANIASMYVEPEERARWQALMEREGIVRDFEARLYRHDGTMIWVNDTARAVIVERGQVLYYEGSLEDITERKRAEEELRQYQEHLEELVEERTTELRESEERYRTLFNGVPVGLYRTTHDGQVLDNNLATAQMLGYPNRDDAMAEVNAVDMYVDPEERVRWQALMEREGVVRDFEVRVRHCDGTLIWLNDTARAVKDEQGRVIYYDGSLEDITERKELEQEIRRQKEYFEALFVNSPVAIMTSDLDANVVSWNPMAEKLFGYTQEEAIGNHIDDLVANDPGVRQEALAYTRQLLTTDRLQATVKRTRKDGSLVDVEVLVLPAIVAGEKVGYIGIYYDVSELLQARRDAEAANQAKSIFLANMSHELRTPLNAILGFTQLMDGDSNLTPGQQENLAIINQSGEHLLTLINDVLEMSKIEAGQVKLRETTFDLYYLLDSLEEMFRLRAENKGLSLSFQLGEDVPRYVMADEGKLRQVLSNLVGNAIKFTQEGSVLLRVTSLPNGLERREMRFEVQDTGPGISPEDLGAVFDPFVQAAGVSDLISAQTQEGTGLGLSISRQFVRLMGGDITVSSELGWGSHFSFDVVVGIAEAGEALTAQPGRKALGLASGQPVYRLLVVEDRETNRRLLVKLLEQLEFEVREATNGLEAIDTWQRWEPHLIWMDMRMPVMNGREATRRIKSMPGGQSVVIIALTATAFEEDREQILLDGCDDFVRKPFRNDDIYDMLIKHLGVSFIYEGEPAFITDAGVSGATTPLADVQALAALPPDWVEELRQATARADLYRILDLIDQIREQYPALADTLADLMERYEYQKILSLIEETGG